MWRDVICYLTKTELLIDLRTLLSTEPSSELNSTEVTINVRICTKMILRLHFNLKYKSSLLPPHLFVTFCSKESAVSASIELNRASRPDRIERREVVVCI